MSNCPNCGMPTDSTTHLCNSWALPNTTGSVDVPVTEWAKGYAAGYRDGWTEGRRQDDPVKEDEK